MTNRENCLLAYQHKTPAYIPCFFTDIALIQACPQMERYTGLSRGGGGKITGDVNGSIKTISMPVLPHRESISLQILQTGKKI